MFGCGITSLDRHRCLSILWRCSSPTSSILPWAVNSEKTAIVDVKILNYYNNVIGNLFAENNGAKVGVWGKEDILRSLNTAQKMLPAVLVNLELYLSRPYPLPELNLVALPGYTNDKPIDAWGLQMFREVDLSKKRDDFWVAHLLAKYTSLQWTDHLTTPLFPTSLTLALSKFLADKVAWQV